MRPWITNNGWMPWSAVCMVAAGLLAGCARPDEFAPACPTLNLLPDGADLSSFNGHGQDVTDLLVSARITAAPAKCRAGSTGKVSATMNVVMAVSRGPALPARTAQVPYFVTVMDGNRVLQQKDYVMPVTFPPNVDQVTATSDDIAMEFPVTATKSAAAYTIFVAFRLTPEQLQYNRRNATP